MKILNETTYDFIIIKLKYILAVTLKTSSTNSNFALLALPYTLMVNLWVKLISSVKSKLRWYKIKKEEILEFIILIIGLLFSAKSN